MLHNQLFSANILEQVADFVEPAEISPEALAKIGRTLFENEWTAHRQELYDAVPMAGQLDEYMFKLAVPLAYVGGVVCQNCEAHVQQFQDLLHAYPLAEYTVRVLGLR